MPRLTENNHRIIFNRLIDYDAEKVSQFEYKTAEIKHNEIIVSYESYFYFCSFHIVTELHQGGQNNYFAHCCGYTHLCDQWPSS